MSKKYLIDEEKTMRWKGVKVFVPSDAKKVEVLDNSDIRNILSENTKFAPKTYSLFTDYLKANNLLIVKIKE